MSSIQLRRRVLRLYKQILFVARDSPQGYDFIRQKTREEFAKNRHITEPDRIKGQIVRGNYMIREMEALYKLKKYRTLKKRYLA